MKEKTGYKHTMYTDPDRVLYKALELNDKVSFGDGKSEFEICFYIQYFMNKLTGCA